MKRYLCEAGVLLKDFGAYATALSNRIRAAAHAFAAHERRPVRYLHSTALSKEELARTLAARDRIDSGLIGLLDIVEPSSPTSCAGTARFTGSTSNCGRASACITTFIFNTPSSA
jgi:hypothetical protein